MVNHVQELSKSHSRILKVPNLPRNTELEKMWNMKTKKPSYLDLPCGWTIVILELFVMNSLSSSQENFYQNRDMVTTFFDNRGKK